MPDRVEISTTTFDEATLRRRRAEQRRKEDARRLRYPRPWLDPSYYADPRYAYPASWLTSAAANSPNTQAFWDRQQLAAQASLLTPEQERAVSTYAATGMVTADMAAGLASAARQLQVDEDTMNTISMLDTTAQAMEGDQVLANSQIEPKSEADKGALARTLGNVTRPLFAMLSMPGEYLEAAMRSIVGGIQEGDLEQIGQAAGQISTAGQFSPANFISAEGEPSLIEQTHGGQWLQGVIDPNYSADLGDGWFPAGEAYDRMVQARRDAAPLIHGEHWEPGRHLASLFIEDPDSLAYRNTSGFIDLVSTVVLDPLVILGGAGAGAKTAQAGARTAAGLSTGQRAAAAGAEEALRTPQAWLVPQETVAASIDHVRRAVKDFTTSVRGNGQYYASTRQAAANDRYDTVADRLAFAQSDAPPTTLVPDDEIAGRVNNALGALTEDGVGAVSAEIGRHAPDLPGVITQRKPAANSSIVGSMDGVDSVVTVTKADPVLASIDDAVDVKALRRAVTGLKAPKRVKDLLKSTLGDLRANPSYMDVVEAAARTGTPGTLAAALRNMGVDGIEDLFRLSDGSGGVWWVTNDIDVVRWGDGNWGRVAKDSDSISARIGELRKEQRSAAGQKAKATQDAGIAQVTAAAHADQFAKVMDGKLNVENASEAVQTAVEYALGVRRSLGGRPTVDHNAIKQFFFGTRNDFDDAVNLTRTSGLRATLIADRALLGVATVGISEAVRATGRMFGTPLLASARRKILDDLVRLDDTPMNLGRLHRLTRGKLEHTVLRNALRATNEEEVLEALAPAMGVAVQRPITPKLLDLARHRAYKVEMGRDNNHLFNRGIRYIIDAAERQGSIAPRGLVSLNFADPQGSADVLRNYLNNIPGIRVNTTDTIVGNYLAAPTEVARGQAAVDGFNMAADVLVAHNQRVLNLSDDAARELAKAVKDGTRLYDGGRADVNSFWTSRYIADGNLSVMDINGQKVTLPAPQLEAELARGGVTLPDMTKLRDAIGRWGAFLDKPYAGTAVEKARDISSAMNDYWRSAVLLRPAYVLRNIGEMQSRMFLVGHASLFRHPLAVAAFAIGANTKNEKIRNLMDRFTKANRTATGHRLSSIDAEDAYGVDEALDAFIENTAMRTSRLDMRAHRALEAFHGLEQVRVGDPGFTSGLAEQLIMLRTSRITRWVAGAYPKEVSRQIERGMDPQDAVVNWLLSSPQGRKVRQEFADNRPEFVRVFGNPRVGTPGDPVALKQLLYTAEGSIADRIAYFTGGSNELLDFIRTGTLKNADGVEEFSMAIRASDANTYQRAMRLRTRRMARKLAPHISNFPDDQKLYMRVLRSRGPVEKTTGPINKVFDAFFNWAGKMENAVSVGPEFAFAYHEKLAQLLPAIQRSQRREVFDVVRAAQGKMRSLSETMHVARAGLKSADEGVLTIEDASAMAAAQASEHVKTFFYDAMRRQQFFHAARLVWPFAQSFVDTLYKWGKLSAQRPYSVAKVGRLGTALQEPGSSVIYDDFDWLDPWTNRQTHDPSQGFLWTDPQTGEQRFTFPLIGSALGAMLSPVVGAMTGESIPEGVNMAEMMTLSAPLRNLNIALQGDVDYLPGAGPLITFPMNVFFDDYWFGDVPEFFRQYLFPYGQPPLEGGVLEQTFAPTWARRLTGAYYNDEQRAYSVKGAMAYLASINEYPGFRDNPEVAEQFKQDVIALSKVSTWFRAFGAAVLPAAPGQEFFAQDVDGNLIASAQIADRYYHILEQTGYDNEAAIAALGETYGLETLAAVAIGATEGEDTPFSKAAWEWFKDNPRPEYADVIGHFFPGDYSFESNQWARESNSRRRLSVDERTDALMEFLYLAERRQLEGKAAKLGWDASAIRQAQADLDETYANVVPAFEVGQLKNEIESIRRAIDNVPELASTRGGQGAQLAFESYDKYKAEAENRFGPGSTLSSQQATPLRQAFLQELDVITAEYGGFNLDEGSVDTIAGMFARLVGEE